MSSDPAVKHRLLQRAKALAEKREVFRYQSVTQLIHEAVAFGVRGEADIFEAAYGDPSGKQYWSAYLSEVIPVKLLADLLSVHMAENIQQLDYGMFATLCAFRDAAEAGEPWFVGDITTLLAIREFGDDLEGVRRLKVDPRAAIQWLLTKPLREHLVPESLQLFLQDERITAATTEKFPKALDAQVLAGNSPREPVAQPRKKSRPAFERARRVIEELYSDRPPDQVTVSNKSLCKQVNEELKEMGQQPVSQDTVERAAGRRK